MTALLGISNPAWAATDKSPDAADSRTPTSTASAQVMADPARPVEIISLFRSDCAPCRYELTILPHIAERFPNLLVTLLVLYDDGVLARQADTLRRPNLRIRIAEDTPREVMARYGNDKRALPFSVALDRTGRVCGRHYGLLGLDLAEEWGTAC